MTRRLLIALCAAVMIVCSAAFVYAEPAEFGTFEDSYEGKTVILQTNDVHGAINQYKYLAGVKNELVKRGADVYVVDSGDYLQGSVYVSWDDGESAIEMMNAAGYDLVTIGNHDFDYKWDRMMEIMQKRNFRVICDDVIVNETGEPLFDGTDMITNGDLKIGFFGVDTPQTKTSSRPVNTEGLGFFDNSTKPKIFEQAAADVKSLREDGADVVLALSHLGVDSSAKPYRSYELWDAAGGKDNSVDLILDGHSHTVMTSGNSGESIMSTGTKLVNIGVVVIDEKTEKIDKWFLYKIVEDTWTDDSVQAVADKIVKKVKDLYGKKVCDSDVELNGYKSIEEVKAAGKDFPSGNRDGETNFGDLAADAYRAQALSAIAKGEKYDVDADHIVGLINGGGIRAGIQSGDVTGLDLLNAFPFYNSISGVYVKGSVLLEALEASTFAMPETAGAFPQISGIDCSINIGVPYAPNAEPYPGSTYYGPAEIRRVKINSINGKPFDADDTYLVMTINFIAAGGDTYYVFGQAEKSFDTGVLDIDSFMAYIRDILEGKISISYKDPAGRIQIVNEPEKMANPMVVKTSTKKVSAKKLKKKAVKVKPVKVSMAEGTVTYKKTAVYYKKPGSGKYRKVGSAKGGSSGTPRFIINKKTGKITVRKALSKGTYKIKVKVAASGNSTYKTKTKTVTAKIKVK